MARTLNGLAVTDFNGAINTEGLFINDNPVVASGASNFVLVGALADFPAPVGGVITLENDTLYQITRGVDISPNRIDYGSGSVIEGLNSSISSLTSDTLEPLLSGSVLVEKITLIADNPISISNNNLVVLRTALAGFSTGIKINNGGRVLISNVLSAGGGEVIEISGAANEFIEISGGNYIDYTVSAVDVSGSTIEVIIITDVIFSSTTGSSSAIKGDGESANLNSGAIVGGCAFVGSGGALDGITKKDIKWVFSSNIGVNNSVVVGSMEQVSNSATTILITATPVQLAGAFLESASIERFNVSSNMLVAEVSGSGMASISMDGSASGGGATETYEILLLQNGVPNPILRQVDIDIASGSINLNIPVIWNVGDNFSIAINRLSGIRDWITLNATLIIQ